MTLSDAQARRERLAREAAERNHAGWQVDHNYKYPGGNQIAHSDGPFESCPHPDCVAVREPEPPQPEFAELLGDLRTLEGIYVRDRIAQVLSNQIESIFDKWLYAEHQFARRTCEPTRGHTLTPSSDAVGHNTASGNSTKGVSEPESAPPAPAPPGVDLEAIKRRLRGVEKSYYERPLPYSECKALIEEVERLAAVRTQELNHESRTPDGDGAAASRSAAETDGPDGPLPLARRRINAGSATAARSIDGSEPSDSRSSLAAVRTPPPESDCDPDRRVNVPAQRVPVYPPVATIRKATPRPFRDDEAVQSPAEARELAWQPIETAPKDLSEILIYDANTDYVYVGQYEMHAQPPFWSYDPHDLTRNKTEIALPTHWMPLPAPPRVEETPTPPTQET